MKVAVVYESRTGNTADVAQRIAAACEELGHDIGVWDTKSVNLDFLTAADMVFLGTWTDGIILAGHRPGDSGRLLNLPGIWGKPTAGFVTYALHAGNVIDKLGDVVHLVGGTWLGGRAFRRDKKSDGLASFVVAALDAAESRTVTSS